MAKKAAGGVLTLSLLKARNMNAQGPNMHGKIKTVKA